MKDSNILNDLTQVGGTTTRWKVYAVNKEIQAATLLAAFASRDLAETYAKQDGGTLPESLTYAMRFEPEA